MNIKACIYNVFLLHKISLMRRVRITQNFLNETGQNYTKFPVKQNNFFMTEVPIIKNHFIDLQSKSMNQWIGFYMIRTCIMKEVVRQVNLFDILRY